MNGSIPSLFPGTYFGFATIQPTAGASLVFTKMYPSFGSVAVPPQLAPPVTPGKTIAGLESEPSA